MTQKAAPGREIGLPGAAFSQERVTAGLRVASAVLARSAVSVGCLDRAERGGSVRKAALGGEPEGARIGLSELQSSYLGWQKRTIQASTPDDQ